ncbi:MAG TPA: arginine N-succinyltransferase [Caulobacteraceae bacterium]|nr:arginine N-succinyltransferase [Caulobacteraceae bacterium]
MLVVRPAGPADLDALFELAVLSGPGFTSLPEDEQTLRERLDCSRASFAGELNPLECWYSLMLEDTETGQVDGVAGVKAAVGLKRPFFSFRVVGLSQFSSILTLRFDHKALVLVNECAGWSEVGSLFLKAERRQGGAGRLLAQSRYMLIASEPQRFAEMVLAELRGWFEEDGSCPFWEHVAQKFFRIPFGEADRMSASTDGQFILDLAPRHPIYVEVLPEPARAVIGRVHKDGEAAKALLQREGFRETGLIDIFDAGPTVACVRDDIRTVRESRRLRVEIARGGADTDTPVLASVDGIENFRATRAPVATDEERAYLTAEIADALRVREGDAVRIRA